MQRNLKANAEIGHFKYAPHRSHIQGWTANVRTTFLNLYFTGIRLVLINAIRFPLFYTWHIIERNIGYVNTRYVL